MHLLFGLCLVAAIGAPSSGGRYADGDVVYSADFNETADQDFNGWPDGWTRRKGPGYPHYVKIFVDHAAQGDFQEALQIDLNGGAAEVFSPPVPIDDQHDYAITGSLRTEGLVHDRARISLQLLDGQKQPLATIGCKFVTGTSTWQAVESEPANLSRGIPKFAVIALSVEPTNQKLDLRGSVGFRQLRLLKLPRLTITANEPSHVYSNPKQVAVTICAAGLKKPVDHLQLQLVDHAGQVLDEQQVELSSTAMSAPKTPAPDAAVAPTPVSEYQGTTSWQPPLPGYGYYRIRALLTTSEGTALEQSTAVAVAEERTAPRGRFGWSLASDAQNAPPDLLTARMIDSGIGWLKIPLWASSNDKAKTQRNAELIETLSRKSITCIGILATPPVEVQEELKDVNLAAAADLFTAPAKIWYPSIQSLFVRYSMQVRYWQLGTDHDTSFVGYPGLMPQLTAIKQQLEESGQNLNLGVGWDWIEELPPTPGNSLRFVSMSANPPLLTNELEGYLVGGRPASLSRWVLVEPRALEGNTPDERAIDLVDRMVTAAACGADAIFFADPVDGAAGLIDPDGRPTQLYLPWRNIAMSLSGATYLGEIHLPGGSTNRTFVRGKEAVMVVSSPIPKEECLYLGDHLVTRDMYGAIVETGQNQQRNVIQVGPSPLIVSGLNAATARWRTQVRFAQPNLPSVPGKPLDQELTFTNTFDQTIAGRLSLVTPVGWNVSPSQFEFRLAAGETLAKPLKITLPYDAESGRQQVECRFDVFADQPYRFEVLRPLEIGLRDVEIQLDTQIDESGTLEIEQRLINNTDRPVRLRCSLFAKDRHRQQFELIGPSQSQAVATFRIKNGTKLLGETLWFRAAEVGTGRVFNYRFVVEK